MYDVNMLLRKIKCLYSSQRLCLVLIFFGIILRLYAYLGNRSLWLDEASLALNIVNRTFSELLQPLDYQQGAPIGFLMVEKLFVQAFGNNEFTLRFFPFLCGIISIFIFYKVAKYYIAERALPIALTFFVVSTSLIYYSSEVKQYSSDVTIALLLYLVMIDIETRELTAVRSLFLGIVGAVMIWFSHPAVFVLAGVGLSLILFRASSGKWGDVRRLLIAYLVWTASFAVCYFLVLKHLAHNEGLLNYWEDFCLAGSYNTFYGFGRGVKIFLNMFNYPVALTFSGIAVLMFIVGCVNMFQEKRYRFSCLISPIILTLIASGFRRYPFGGRLILFIVPIVIILIARGVENISVKGRRYSIVVKLICVGLLVLNPLKKDLSCVVYGRKFYGVEEIKPVLGYVKLHWRKGDLLYVYPLASNAFKYYSQKTKRENKWDF